MSIATETVIRWPGLTGAAASVISLVALIPTGEPQSAVLVIGLLAGILTTLITIFVRYMLATSVNAQARNEQKLDALKQTIETEMRDTREHMTHTTGSVVDALRNHAEALRSFERSNP